MTTTDNEELMILFCFGSFGVVCCFLLFLVWNCTEKKILFYCEKIKTRRRLRNRLECANRFRQQRFQVQVESESHSLVEIVRAPGTQSLPSYEQAIALATHKPSSNEETVPSYEEAVAAARERETLPTYKEAVAFQHQTERSPFFQSCVFNLQL
jgi:hypothetical protein